MLGHYKIKKFIPIAAALVMLLLFTACNQSGAVETAAAGKENTSLYFFNYKDISIDTTTSIGIKIQNCNIYLDKYGDLIVLGELENNSGSIETDIETTIDFLDAEGNEIYADIIPVKTDYLRNGARYPFEYHFSESQKYIEISSVKIGVNYRDYKDDLEGNPIAEIEEYSYQDDYLIIEGRIVNIGEKNIKNLKLLCTFYDTKDRVAFIRECYLLRERMIPDEVQNFTLEVYLDQYLQEFSRFRFEIFFKDAIGIGI